MLRSMRPSPNLVKVHGYLQIDDNDTNTYNSPPEKPATNHDEYKKLSNASVPSLRLSPGTESKFRASIGAKSINLAGKGSHVKPGYRSDPPVGKDVGFSGKRHSDSAFVQQNQMSGNQKGVQSGNQSGRKLSPLRESQDGNRKLDGNQAKRSPNQQRRQQPDHQRSSVTNQRRGSTPGHQSGSVASQRRESVSAGSIDIFGDRQIDSFDRIQINSINKESASGQQNESFVGNQKASDQHRVSFQEDDLDPGGNQHRNSMQGRQEHPKEHFVSQQRESVVSPQKQYPENQRRNSPERNQRHSKTGQHPNPNNIEPIREVEEEGIVVGQDVVPSDHYRMVNQAAVCCRSIREN